MVDFRNKDLKRMEDIHERYHTLEKIPMEDKIIAAAEEGFSTVAPWEIQTITQDTIRKLQQIIDLPVEEMDLIFDIIYDAVSTGANHAE